MPDECLMSACPRVLPAGAQGPCRPPSDAGALAWHDTPRCGSQGCRRRRHSANCSPHERAPPRVLHPTQYCRPRRRPYQWRRHGVAGRTRLRSGAHTAAESRVSSVRSPSPSSPPLSQSYACELASLELDAIMCGVVLRACRLEQCKCTRTDIVAYIGTHVAP